MWWFLLSRVQAWEKFMEFLGCQRHQGPLLGLTDVVQRKAEQYVWHQLGCRSLPCSWRKPQLTASKGVYSLILCQGLLPLVVCLLVSASPQWSWYYFTHNWDPQQLLGLRVRPPLGAIVAKGQLHIPQNPNLPRTIFKQHIVLYESPFLIQNQKICVQKTFHTGLKSIHIPFLG